MVIDTSALDAILRAEPDASSFARAIAGTDVRLLSVATYVEVGAVIDGSRDPVASRRLDELLHAAGIRIEPVTVHQGELARALDEPLLFKGDDFGRTDVASAL